MPRALLSVYDKTGIIDLAEGLVGLGWDLVSSGGTAKAISDAGLPVTDLAEFTGYPAMLGHRVVTLHPLIHGAILADPNDEEHQADMEKYGIKPFDLVVGNLYPFAEDPKIEMIDIGGPAMVRGAAKNHANVLVVVDPADYGTVLDELRTNGGFSDDLRRRFAKKAFNHTAAYEVAVANWFNEDDQGLPAQINLALERVDPLLRYGENPHQTGARYRTIGQTGWWDRVEQHQGMALSYLNLYDADAAWRLVNFFGDNYAEPAVAIIKHANPSGFALDASLSAAYQKSLECDEMSAFGGIVAFNRVVDMATAAQMAAGPQADVVIAPGYEEGVLGVLLKKRKNTRVLTAPDPGEEFLQFRELSGGSWLVQDAHGFRSFRDQWRVVTKRQPTEAEMDDAEVAFFLGGFVKSNSIVLVKDRVAWGIGAGQQNRVESARIAAAKADGRARGGAAGSDAFWPFPDGVDSVAPAEPAVLIQPGGAQHDADVIARADELGLAMVFTGERHFYH